MSQNTYNHTRTESEKEPAAALYLRPTSDLIVMFLTSN